MKYIWLGIKDYCKDCWHDWLVYRLFKIYKRPIYVDDYNSESFIHIDEWREGNLWFYIQNRRIANKRKKK